MVAIGLGDSRRLFGRSSTYQSFLNWLKLRPKFGGNNYVLVAGEEHFKMGNDLLATCGIVGKAPHTLEERIALLQERLDLADGRSPSKNCASCIVLKPSGRVAVTVRDKE